MEVSEVAELLRCGDFSGLGEVVAAAAAGVASCAMMEFGRRARVTAAKQCDVTDNKYVVEKITSEAQSMMSLSQSGVAMVLAV